MIGVIHLEDEAHLLIEHGMGTERIMTRASLPDDQCDMCK